MQYLFKFKGPSLKSNPKYKFFSFYFEFLNTHISHLIQLPMITMVLKWHHKNISSKIIVMKEFQWSFDMVYQGHIKWKQKTNIHIIKKKQQGAYEFKQKMNKQVQMDKEFIGLIGICINPNHIKKRNQEKKQLQITNKNFLHYLLNHLHTSCNLISKKCVKP